MREVRKNRENFIYLGMVNKKKETRVQGKAVHVTIHKLENESIGHWIEKGKSFRSNVNAVLVGLEKNHEEEKGLHAHIVIQFTTRQDLSRKQFVDHFESDTLHIAVKPNKDALLMALGYVSKTGNIKQWGEFMYRGRPLDSSPEVYKFQYQVKSKEDGIRYFHKVIKENMYTNKNIIKEYAKRDDAIGIWLQKNPTVVKTLHKLACTWHLDALNKQKVGFKFYDWVSDPKKLSKEYRAYLKDFPEIFKNSLPEYSDLVLEDNYNKYEAHDLKVVNLVVGVLNLAMQYGPNRPHKYLNLYLWSRNPSFGKTRLLEFLDDHLMAYRLPDDQYYVDYENGMYQVLVSDEAAAFLKSKDYSHLKHILEGKRVEFNLKGREKIFKEDNPLIVLAENESFESLMERHFPKRYNKLVMSTRVLDLELKSRATLHFLIDRCVVKENAAPFVR